MAEQTPLPQIIETWTAGSFKFIRVSVPEAMEDFELVEWAQENLYTDDWLSYSADGSEVIFCFEKEG